MSRKENKKKEILSVLKNAGSRGITNRELSKIALRYGGYLGMLYEEGYNIEKINLGEGMYKYIYISSPKSRIKRARAYDSLINEIEKAGKVGKEEFIKILEAQNISVRYKPNTYRAMNRAE